MVIDNWMREKGKNGVLNDSEIYTLYTGKEIGRHSLL